MIGSVNSILQCIEKYKLRGVFQQHLSQGNFEKIILETFTKKRKIQMESVMFALQRMAPCCVGNTLCLRFDSEEVQWWHCGRWLGKCPCGVDSIFLMASIMARQTKQTYAIVLFCMHSWVSMVADDNDIFSCVSFGVYKVVVTLLLLIALARPVVMSMVCLCWIMFLVATCPSDHLWSSVVDQKIEYGSWPNDRIQ